MADSSSGSGGSSSSMADTLSSWLNPIGALGGLFGGIMGGISGQQALDWLHGAYVNNLNFGRDQYSNWMQRYFDNADPLRDQALGAGDIFGNMVRGSVAPYMDAANALPGQVPGLFQQYGGSYQSPMIDQASQGLSSLMGGANQVFQGGGWTPWGQGAYDTGYSLATGQNDPMRALSNLGQNFLNTGGGTDLNRLLQERAGEAVNAGGLTDILRGATQGIAGIAGTGGATDYSKQGIGAALQMLTNGGQTAGTNALDAAGMNALTGNLGVSGLTNTGAVGELAALQGIQGGGQTATSNALNAKAMEILKTNPMLSLEDAVAMARDAAATAANQQARTVRGRALARGGGPGSIVSSGSQNEAMTDFADQALQAEAQAGRDALMKQQGVLGDYQKLGATLGLGAGDLEKGTLGTYADLLKGLEGVAASRFGTGGQLLGQGTSLANERSQIGLGGLTNLGGLETNRLLSALGLAPTIQNSATNNANVMGNLGLGGDTSQINRMNTGTNMLQQWLQSSLGGGNLQNAANTAAQNYGLGMGSLGQGAANNLGNLGVNAGQLGLSNFQNLFNALNSGLTTQGNALQTGMQGWQNLGMNPLLNLAQQAGQLTNTFGGNTSQLPGMTGSNNSWNALAQGGK